MSRPHMSDLLKEFLFSMPTAASKNVTKGNPVCFSISQLEAARPDLTIPEVGSEEEKNLFFKVCENGQSWGQVDNVWFADRRTLFCWRNEVCSNLQ